MGDIYKSLSLSLLSPPGERRGQGELDLDRHLPFSANALPFDRFYYISIYLFIIINYENKTSANPRLAAAVTDAVTNQCRQCIKAD